MTAPLSAVSLTAGRLHLRPWEPWDADEVHAACQDREVQRWTTVPAPYTAEDARAYVTELSPRGWEAGTTASFAVLDATTARVHASVALMEVADGSAELGFWTAPGSRRQGYTAEAVGAVCRWGFGALGLERVLWRAEVGNWGSRAVAEAGGFTVEGTQRRGLVHRGSRVDSWTGSLLADDEVRDRRAFGGRWTDLAGEGLLLRLSLAGVNALIAVLVVVLADWSAPSLVMLPPVLAAMYASYRGYLQAAHERDVWQQLETATREFNSLDLTTVVDAALSRSAQLFRADVVTVSLEEPTGTTVYTGDASGLVTDDGARASLVAPGQSDGSGGATALTVYSAPLEGPRGRIGMLQLGFRGPVELRRREQQVLRTLAHAISSTLQNARLYGEMRSHAEAKAYEASHDALTGLGNRSLLQEQAVRTMAADAERGTQSALLIVDLDHFKEINDTLGHATGDQLLRQVGQRIAAAVPQADAVCRLGGDEFAVLLGGCAQAEDADVLAAELLRLLAEPAVFDGLRLSVEGSVGIACAPSDATSFDELLKRADVALYQAKDTRGAFSHYSADRDESSLHRLALAAELRTALAEDQLVVHFQPQYELRTRTLIGAEALVRWQHPQRGLLPPSEFISAVEHSGLIRSFTMTVLEKAVVEAAAWSGSGRVMSVAVNLSARNLLDRELPADVARVLQRHGLAPERLVLEITETTMMSELDVVEDVLAQLRRLGVELSVDDFGTGYSSLAFLQRVRVNEVKVDRSFVAGLSDSENSRALVRATVQLAHSLGARAVGEGVEDEALAGVLRELGCDYGQGYHLGRPMPADDLRALLGLAPAGAPVRREPEPRHLRSVVVLPG